MILDRILADKRTEVAARKAEVPQDGLKLAAQDAPPARDFVSGLCIRESATRDPQSEIRLIAEVKKASPSKGLIRPDFDPAAIARTYEEAGASAVSVLTDEKYFEGRLEYLDAIHRAVELPLLRKDFTIDAYQVYEARAASADAILLIAAALSREELREFMVLADDLGMASLVEVHTAEELDAALEVGARIVGINNRNLQSFETKLETTLGLASRVPGDRILVSESGIFTRADVERLMEAGVDAMLVGEALMREPDPGAKARELLGSNQ